MKSFKYGDRIVFDKVNDNLYNARPEDIDEFKNTLTNILTGITLCPIDSISALMDLVIGEELTARIVVDSFIYKYTDITVKGTDPIKINFILGDMLYPITVGYNKDKLGGIVYSLV